MKSYLMRGLVVAVLAVPLLIASCSKKDKGTGPTNSGSPPSLTIPQFAQTVNFVGSNSSIQGAKAKVQAELALVAPWLVTPTAVAAALNAGQWGAKTADSCWPKSTSSGNCTTSDKVCNASAGSFDWSRTQSGTCGGVDHSNWVQYSGNTSASGGSGSLSAFKSNSTDVDTLWAWSAAADNSSKDWNVYHGAQAPANLLASLHWAKGGSNSSDWTFQQSGSASAAAGVTTTDPAKWTLHVSSDAKTGIMDVYQWSATAGSDAFWLQHHIAWNPDSTGSWIEYDRNHNIVHQNTWPTTLPHIAQPAAIPDVVINNTSQCAVAAKTLAESQIGLARAFASTGESFLGVLDTIHMGNEVNGCWNWQGSYEECPGAYSLCQVSNGFHWTVTVDGTCSSHTYNHWVAYEGNVSSDGTTGSFIGYDQNSTNAMMALTWSTAADGKSGTWSSYTGAVADTNLQLRLTWSDNADGSADITFQMFGESPMKWVTHESADGSSGTMKMYDWDSVTSQFWLQTDVEWSSNGSGFRKTYLEDGTVIDQCVWP